MKKITLALATTLIFTQCSTWAMNDTMDKKPPKDNKVIYLSLETLKEITSDKENINKPCWHGKKIKTIFGANKLKKIALGLESINKSSSTKKNFYDEFNAILSLDDLKKIASDLKSNLKKLDGKVYFADFLRSAGTEKEEKLMNLMTSSPDNEDKLSSLINPLLDELNGEKPTPSNNDVFIPPLNLEAILSQKTITENNTPQLTHGASHPKT